MKDILKTLLSIGSDSLGEKLATWPSPSSITLKENGHTLKPLLLAKNGFVAFEGSLHIFPVGKSSQGHDIDTWNSTDLWRNQYGDMAEGHLFFAEDLFGEQFSIKDSYIYRFNPETGLSEIFAEDLSEWASVILDDYETETGYPLAHAWQERYGIITANCRLIPKIPFIAGGEYEIENLYLAESVDGMCSRAAIARQMRNVPDGTSMSFTIIP